MNNKMNNKLTVLAVLAIISRQAGASVRVDAIDTGGAVHASVSEMAFVDVDLAIDTRESSGTGARVGADEVFTGATILTRTVLTLIDVDLTSLAFESG